MEARSPGTNGPEEQLGGPERGSVCPRGPVWTRPAEAEHTVLPGDDVDLLVLRDSLAQGTSEARVSDPAGRKAGRGTIEGDGFELGR